MVGALFIVDTPLSGLVPRRPVPGRSATFQSIVAVPMTAPFVTLTVVL